MKVTDALQGVSSIFLDTAPVIYYVEKNPLYLARVREVMMAVNNGALTAITSSITLAECLVGPLRMGNQQLEQDFVDIVVSGRNTRFISLDVQRARRAAALRAKYNIGLLDALQFACALHARCDAFLTNDAILTRVTDLRVILVDDLET